MAEPTIELKKTKADEDLFAALHESHLGRGLVSYLERLGDALCDLRTMKNDISTSAGQAEYKGRQIAAAVIQENLYRELTVRESDADIQKRRNQFM